MIGWRLEGMEHMEQRKKQNSMIVECQYKVLISLL